MYYVISSPLSCTCVVGAAHLLFRLCRSLSCPECLGQHCCDSANQPESSHWFVVITPLQGFGGSCSGSRSAAGNTQRREGKTAHRRHEEGMIGLTAPMHLRLFTHEFTNSHTTKPTKDFLTLGSFKFLIRRVKAVITQTQKVNSLAESARCILSAKKCFSGWYLGLNSDFSIIFCIFTNTVAQLPPRQCKSSIHRMQTYIDIKYARSVLGVRPIIHMWPRSRSTSSSLLPSQVLVRTHLLHAPECERE